MSEQKKDKPKVDVRDLKPTKDAKGGVRAAQRSAQSGTRSVQSGSRSTQ